MGELTVYKCGLRTLQIPQLLEFTSFLAIALKSAPVAYLIFLHSHLSIQRLRYVQHYTNYYLSLLFHPPTNQSNMRTSAVVALAIIATAGPSLAAPVSSPATFARRDAPNASGSADSTDESGAMSLKTGATIASFAAPVVSGLLSVFTGGDKNKQQQQRDLSELAALLRRAQDEIDASGALSFRTGPGFPAGGPPPFWSGAGQMFGGQQQKRDVLALEQLLRRAQDEIDESGAISLKTGATIASLAAPVVGGILNFFTGGNKGQQQQRDFVEMLAREAQDGSEALSFDEVKNVGSIVFHAGEAVKDLYTAATSSGQQQRREDAESGAMTLEEGANAATIGAGIASVVGTVAPMIKDAWDHITHKSSREDDESGALTLEEGANAATIGAGVAGVAGTVSPLIKAAWDRHTHKSSREFDHDESGAISLEDGASYATIGSAIAGVAAPLVKDVYDHFHKSSRDFDDESGAMTLEEGASAATIGAGVAGVAGTVVPLIKDAWDHLTHKSSRDVDDESGAMTLEEGASAATIGAGVAGVAGAVAPLIKSAWDHLTHKSSREYDDSESGAISLEDGASYATIGSAIAGVAAPLVKDVYDHFHKSSRRAELEELLLRSLNDLD